MDEVVKLKLDNTVKKSNVLNEMRNATTSLTEYRLFCICMAHINVNENTDTVRFKLSDYTNIIGLDRPRKEDLQEQAKSIVQTTMTLHDDDGFTVYSVFKSYSLKKYEDYYYVELVFNDSILPFLREQSRRFVRYKLYNTLFLKSFNQQRIYELLKQYEKLGERIIELKDLREYLSIKKDEYSVWYDFSSKVLKVAQTAIAENTDIRFEYEGIRHGRKVGAVKFVIHKNEAYKDRLQLAGWLPKEIIEDHYDGAEFAVKPDASKYAEYRGVLMRPDALTDAQLVEVVELIRMSEWYRRSQPVEDAELYTYLAAQDRYTVAHEPQNYYGYLRDAVLGNYAGLAACRKRDMESSFDTAEFFELALKRSYRETKNE